MCAEGCARAHCRASPETDLSNASATPSRKQKHARARARTHTHARALLQCTHEGSRAHSPSRPATAAADAEEQAKWREWVNGRFVHVLTVNIYGTPAESWQVLWWGGEVVRIVFY